MLRYLHDLGEVIFCRQADAYGIIVTDVDWLLRIFRAIIQLHNCPTGSMDIQSLYEEASKSGKISTKYIDYVLKPYKLDDDTKKSIIKLMESYDILCTIKSDNDQDECHYFVPYFLRYDVKPFDLTKYHEWKKEQVLLWLESNLRKDQFDNQTIDTFLNQFKAHEITGATLYELKNDKTEIATFKSEFSKQNQAYGIWSSLKRALRPLPQ